MYIPLLIAIILIHFLLSNLTVAYDHQGKNRDAEVLYKQCLDKQNVVLGEKHPDTLHTMRNLADTTSKLKSVSLG